MKGSLNCVIFSSKVLSPSLKFKKCSKTFEFCEVNTDSYKTILARGLNPCRKTFPCGTNFQKEEHTRSRRFSCIGDFVEYKEKQFLIRRRRLSYSQLCYWGFCGDRIFPNFSLSCPSATQPSSTTSDWKKMPEYFSEVSGIDRKNNNKMPMLSYHTQTQGFYKGAPNHSCKRLAPPPQADNAQINETLFQKVLL